VFKEKDLFNVCKTMFGREKITKMDLLRETL
jgi:hypothetical protein